MIRKDEPPNKIEHLLKRRSFIKHTTRASLAAAVGATLLRPEQAAATYPGYTIKLKSCPATPTVKYYHFGSEEYPRLKLSLDAVYVQSSGSVSRLSDIVGYTLEYWKIKFTSLLWYEYSYNSSPNIIQDDYYFTLELDSTYGTIDVTHYMGSGETGGGTLDVGQNAAHVFGPNEYDVDIRHNSKGLYEDSLLFDVATIALKLGDLDLGVKKDGTEVSEQVSHAYTMQFERVAM